MLNIYVKFLEPQMITDCYHMILDTGLWILDEKINPLFNGYPASSIQQPASFRLK
jgi:hypothetical protein